MDKAKTARIASPGTAVLDVLANERLRTLALCRALHQDFLALVEATKSSNADDEHDPEGVTVAFERAQVVALLTRFQSQLDEIDVAIRRCQRGSYGICESCGDAIPAERLAARPTASSCLGCAV